MKMIISFIHVWFKLVVSVYSSSCKYTAKRTIFRTGECFTKKDKINGQRKGGCKMEQITNNLQQTTRKAC